MRASRQLRGLTIQDLAGTIKLNISLHYYLRGQEEPACFHQIRRRRFYWGQGCPGGCDLGRNCGGSIHAQWRFCRPHKQHNWLLFVWNDHRNSPTPLFSCFPRLPLPTYIPRLSRLPLPTHVPRLPLLPFLTLLPLFSLLPLFPFLPLFSLLTLFSLIPFLPFLTLLPRLPLPTQFSRLSWQLRLWRRVCDY